MVFPGNCSRIPGEVFFSKIEKQKGGESLSEYISRKDRVRWGWRKPLEGDVCIA